MNDPRKVVIAKYTPNKKKKIKIIKNHNDHIRAKSDKKTHTHQTYRELKWK